MLASTTVFENERLVSEILSYTMFGREEGDRVSSFYSGISVRAANSSMENSEKRSIVVLQLAWQLIK